MDNANKQEVWKDVPHYEGLYQVSNLGHIWSIKFNRMMTNTKNNYTGYYSVRLTNKYKKVKHEYVHRLVALAFIPNPNDLPQVNHKDENKRNNCIENLEWCTEKYNSNYGTGKERAGKKHRKPVTQYDKNGNIINTFDSIVAASKSVGVFHSQISKCCKGKLKTTGGYKWKYALAN